MNSLNSQHGNKKKRVVMTSFCLLLVSLLSGCYDNTDDEALLLPKSSPINETSFDSPTAMSVNEDHQYLDLNHKRLESTHAKFAAEHSDICPKLLVREIDRTSIIREDEILKSEHCDYIIYPEVGKFITAETENDDLELLLVTPDLHDFANGGYLVRAQDKYVIRAVYDGITIRPDELTYDIRVYVE